MHSHVAGAGVKITDLLAVSFVRDKKHFTIAALADGLFYVVPGGADRMAPACVRHLITRMHLFIAVAREQQLTGEMVSS